MAIDGIYHCACSCGCQNEVSDSGVVCPKCKQYCQKKEQEKEDKPDDFSGPGYCAFCACGNGEPGDHCGGGRTCPARCSRHGCLWVCFKCGKCCCFCQCLF